MKRISIITGFFQHQLGEREALRLAKEIGADGVDFTLCDDHDYRRSTSIYSQGEEAVIAHFTALREYAEELGLAIVQTHGRVTGFVDDKEKDAALIENARLDCIATRALGAPVCVIHTNSNSFFGVDATASLMHAKNDELYLQILPFAKEQGIKIATETYGICGTTRTCEFFGLIPEFIEAYDRLAAHPELGEYLTVCVDTGHTHNATQFAGNLSVGETIRRMGSRISVLHIHDNNGKADQHLIPLAGTADWKDIIEALDEIGYEGYYNLEISARHFGDELAAEEAAFAIKVMRNLLQKYGKR